LQPPYTKAGTPAKSAVLCERSNRLAARRFECKTPNRITRALPESANWRHEVRLRVVPRFISKILNQNFRKPARICVQCNRRQERETRGGKDFEEAIQMCEHRSGGIVQISRWKVPPQTTEVRVGSEEISERGARVIHVDILLL